MRLQGPSINIGLSCFASLCAGTPSTWLADKSGLLAPGWVVRWHRAETNSCSIFGGVVMCTVGTILLIAKVSQCYTGDSQLSAQQLGSLSVCNNTIRPRFSGTLLMYKAQRSQASMGAGNCCGCHSSAQGSCLADLGSGLLLLPAVARTAKLGPGASSILPADAEVQF